MDKLNYYQILGVSAQASKEEIKASFKKLAVTLHPDKNLAQVALAEEKFKQVNEAYQVLSNDEKRLAYDWKLYLAAHPTLPEYEEAAPENPVDAAHSYAYRQQSYGDGRPRYAPKVEYEPSVVRRGYLVLGIFFSCFLIGAVCFFYYANHWNANRLYGEAMQAGKSHTAMLHLSEAIGYEKEFWQAYYERGKLRIDVQGDYKHAWYDFNNTIRYADTLTAAMYYHRGMCSLQLGNYQAALDDCNQALKVDARSAPAYFLRSHAYVQLHDTLRACQDWQKAAQLGVDVSDDALQPYCQ